KPCSAVLRCPYSSSSHHYETKDAARKAYEVLSKSSFAPLVQARGQWVKKDAVEVGGFLREVIAKSGTNHRYSGSLEDLERLVEEHMTSSEPGTGSKDGDVLLVNVPTEGFFTDIVKITDENRAEVEEVFEARVA